MLIKHWISLHLDWSSQIIKTINYQPNIVASLKTDCLTSIFWCWPSFQSPKSPNNCRCYHAPPDQLPWLPKASRCASWWSQCFRKAPFQPSIDMLVKVHTLCWLKYTYICIYTPDNWLRHIPLIESKYHLPNPPDTSYVKSAEGMMFFCCEKSKRDRRHK